MKYLFFLIIFSSVQIFAAELRDPTRPDFYVPAGTTNQSMQLNLTGITISSDHRFAVINGNTLKIGDNIGSNKVIAIESNTVQLEGPGGKITLHLFGQSIKEKVTDH